MIRRGVKLAREILVSTNSIASAIKVERKLIDKDYDNPLLMNVMNVGNVSRYLIDPFGEGIDYAPPFLAQRIIKEHQAREETSF